ncbi:MFS transporter [Rhizobium sp.]|uniref:MFS transporter n=1 Tax=Rhizobium sp. TaxID=391 RepID=UPI0028AC73AA
MRFEHIFAVYTFVGPLVTEVADLPVSFIPFAQAFFGVGLALGTLLGGRLADSYEFRGMVIGIVAMLFALLILAFFCNYGVVLCAMLFALGFAVQVAIPTIPVRMTQMAPEAPTLMGAMNMAAFNAANAIGAIAGSMTIAAGPGTVSAVWSGFVLTAMGLVFFGLVYSRLRYVGCSVEPTDRVLAGH